MSKTDITGRVISAHTSSLMTRIAFGLAMVILILTSDGAELVIWSRTHSTASAKEEKHAVFCAHLLVRDVNTRRGSRRITT